MWWVSLYKLFHDYLALVQKYKNPVQNLITENRISVLLFDISQIAPK
ncbi:hypothetical protein AQPE_3018 [Aquipluma nitroreducens]|uniref:Uncharacterized protein n=1 Tax=Aquipluma nitroreducens TaxID=2010828 RepID=A0A5K7SB97_9BACT|nr:hypothetical protein AQPE_3018 [Aquipluma nitroreducens]